MHVFYSVHELSKISWDVRTAAVINHTITVKPPNKGHVGDNINSHALSLVERLSSFRRFELYCYYRETEFSGPRTVLCREFFKYSVRFLEGPLSEVSL